MSRPAFVFLASGLLALPLVGQNAVSRSVPAAAGGRLILRAEFGQIRAVSGANETVNVEVTFRGNGSAAEYQELLRDFTLDVSENAGAVRVDGRFTGGWVSRPQSFWGFLFGGGNSWRFCRDGRCLRYTWLREVEYRVTVPRRFDVDLNTSGGGIKVDNLAGEVRVNTAGGSLDIGRIEGPVNAHTSGGSIAVRGARGRAVLRTSGGSIRLDQVAGDVDAETSGGSIEVTRASGNVRVHTSGGSINVAEPRGGIDASTSGGSIAVRVPGDRGFDIDAATSGGGVSTNFDVPRQPNQPNVLRTSVNGGGPLLRLRTSGGGISIHKSR
jgi:hypothetical protein